jgi:hypothetical protein
MGRRDVVGLRALSAVAYRPGEIVRRMVDELAVETRRAQTRFAA